MFAAPRQQRLNSFWHWENSNSAPPKAPVEQSPLSLHTVFYTMYYVQSEMWPPQPAGAKRGQDWNALSI